MGMIMTAMSFHYVQQLLDAAGVTDPCIEIRLVPNTAQFYVLTEDDLDTDMRTGMQMHCISVDVDRPGVLRQTIDPEGQHL